MALSAPVHDCLPRSERTSNLKTLLSSPALPHDTGESLERSEWFTRVGPFLQLFDTNMIAGFPTGAVLEKRAGYVYHVWRSSSLVE